MEDIIQKYISVVNVAESSKEAYKKHLRWFHRWLDDSGGDLEDLTLTDTQMYIT